MLWSVSDIRGYGIAATDGVVGAVDDLLFDDHTSAVRYLVVDTGEWLPGRQVLLAPEAVGEADPVRRAFPVRLSREQVERSPDISTDQPVARREEARLHEHYGWAPYWTAPQAVTAAPYWGSAAFSVIPPADAPPGAERTLERRAEAAAEHGDPHLRSAQEVIGYYIEATDGDLGHVEDLLVEDASWTIRYIVVDTRNWLPGKKVLVSPQWLRWIEWTSRKVGLDLDRESIRRSPEYNPRTTLDRAYEEQLHRHHDRPLYWV